MLCLCFCNVDYIPCCIGVNMPRFDNCDHVACLNSWSLRIHYYGIIGIMFFLGCLYIISLIVLFKNAWFNE